MEKITVKGHFNDSIILPGESIDNLRLYIPAGKTFIITDHNVSSLYKASWDGLPSYILAPGERSKILEMAGSIYRWLIDNDAGRDSFILGVGGGMVCDIAGFVASTYMRGIGFGFVATSLLAQVDASVGGKNGVNLDGFKNIIGTFNQPGFVLCDPTLLKSLPVAELRNGLAEVVKHALIADRDMFINIEQNVDAIFALEPEMINYLVSRSVHIKAGIVSADERESGLRRVLNLGHTWGHAVEKAEGISHGQAISTGMVFAAGLSVAKGLMQEHEKERLVTLLRKLGLKTETTASKETVFEALLKDKKKEANYINFVLMKGIGDVVVQPVTIDDIQDYIS